MKYANMEDGIRNVRSAIWVQGLRSGMLEPEPEIGDPSWVTRNMGSEVWNSDSGILNMGSELEIQNNSRWDAVCMARDVIRHMIRKKEHVQYGIYDVPSVILNLECGSSDEGF